MENPSYIALSGQLALERQMDVLANNIANMSTTGFKASRMVFAEYLQQTSDGGKIAYVQDSGTVRDFAQGPLTSTGNPLDIGLQGAGFIEVQTANGTRYTRDGRLKLDTQGQLVTLDGEPVLGQGEQPILVPPGSGGISIGQDGTLSSGQGTVGKLAIVTFPQPEELDEEGNGRYATDQTPEPATDTKVMAGEIEGSNVQPILEMTRLWAATRAIGAAKTFQDNESDRHKNAIDRLAKVV